MFMTFVGKKNLFLAWFVSRLCPLRVNDCMLMIVLINYQENICSNSSNLLYFKSKLLKQNWHDYLFLFVLYKIKYTTTLKTFVDELSNYPRLKRLTFSSWLMSSWFSFSPASGRLFCCLASSLLLECLAWQFLVLSHPFSSWISFALPFLRLHEGQVQGSPITLRGLRKL